MASYYDYPEHLITQVILTAQARDDDPTRAATDAAKAYVAGLAAFKGAPGMGALDRFDCTSPDRNTSYLQAAAGSQTSAQVGQTGANRDPQAGRGNAFGATDASVPTPQTPEEYLQAHREEREGTPHPTSHSQSHEATTPVQAA